MPFVYFALAIFMLLFAIFNFDGFYFYDDYAYIFYAEQLASGTYQVDNPDIFAHRWGLVFPLALLIKLFGINEWVVCALPVSATLSSLYLVYLFAKKLPSPVNLHALLFFGLDFYTLFFANKVYPDVLFSALALASLYFLWQRNQEWYWAVGFVFFNFWAFLCKELIIYFIPFYAFVLIDDLNNKRNYAFWLIAIASGLVGIVSYLSIYQHFTGNYFFRFQLIQEGHQLYQQFSYHSKGWEAIVRRITYEPFLMFVNTSLIIPFSGIFGLIIFRNSIKNVEGLVSRFVLFLSLAFFSGLLMFWLMTTSFSYYEPIALYPRHILFLLPLGAMLTAWSLGSSRSSIITAIVLLISAALAWQSIGYKTASLYVLLGSWILMKNFSILKTKQLLWSSGLALILLLHPLYTMLKPQQTGYWEEKQIFEKHILSIQKPCIIYTDDKLLTGHRWYFQFRKPEFIVFKNFTDFKKDKSPTGEEYVLVNEYSIKYFKEIGTRFPDFVEKIPDNWEKVSSANGVSLYLVARHR